MRNPRTLVGFLIALAITAGCTIASASTYKCPSKGDEELTKGQVIRVLVSTPKEKCTKTDVVIFDEKSGTVKNAPKD